MQLETLRAKGDKAQAMETMTRGAAAIAAKLYAAKQFDALISLGGTAGTAIGSSAMRVLPIGVPKVLVSTVAAGDTRPYVGATDITMMYSVVDIAGLNRISTRVLANAAGAAIGMVETEVRPRQERPLIAASMFGNTTACVDRARGLRKVDGLHHRDRGACLGIAYRPPYNLRVPWGGPDWGLRCRRYRRTR